MGLNRAGPTLVLLSGVACALALVPAGTPAWGRQGAQGQERADLPAAPGDPDRGLDEAVLRSLRALDAGRTGWESEELGSSAVAQLEALARPGGAASVLAGEFRCRELLPAGLQEVHAGPGFRVLRQRPAADDAPAAGDGWRGFFAAAGELHFKVTRVEVDGERLRTRVRVDAMDGEGVQRDARWDCLWTLEAGSAVTPSGAAPVSAPPRLLGIELLAYTEVRASGRPALFSDCTESVLGGEVFARQLLPSLPYWRARLDSRLDIGYLGHHGLAIGDVDGDGLEDLYLCQPGGLPNRLYLHQAGGGAREVSARFGVDFIESSQSALLIDLDGDRDLDLALAMDGDVVFLRNTGGRFEIASATAAPNTTSMAAADFDLDGDLDLYACGYVSPYDTATAPIPYHDANNGQPNLLLRNEGDFIFVDVTAEVGLDANNSRFSFAVAWEDYDNDGDQDLYVANDFGRNNLYRNDGGSFTDVAAELGVEDISAGMGVTWGDHDRDGWMDLYVSNMFSSAGGRITYQRHFRPGTDAQTLAELQRHARGNSLFRNLGGAGFEDVTPTAGAEMGRWAWGASFADIDNDGWQDLLVPNGFVTNARSDDL